MSDTSRASSTSVSSQVGITTVSESTSSTTYGTALETSSPDSSDGLAASLGDDTLATGSVSAVMADEGDIATLDSTVTMAAASEAADGETAFASADSFTDVTGAEMTFSYTRDSQLSGSGSTAIATSTTTTTAYSIQVSTSGTSAPSEDNSLEGAAADQAEPDTSLTDADGSVNLDGNVAYLEFSALAIGDDSLVVVDAFALTIEDELSISAAFVELAVD
jgi:peptidoglycan DL-endopeptidase CwlO